MSSRANSAELRWLKPLILRSMNVAAEAATHNEHLRDVFISNVRFEIQLSQHAASSIGTVPPQHYCDSGARADSCHRCRKYHSKNITRNKKQKPRTVAANTSANK